MTGREMVWILCACALASLAGSVHDEAINLVSNSGFEAADPDNPKRPAGFEPGRVGEGRIAEMTWESPGYRGDKCIAVETRSSDDLGYWQTVVPVKSETQYTISFFYKTNSAGAGRAIGGEPLYDQGRAGGPNLELGMVPDDPADAAKPTRWSDIEIAMEPLGGTYLPVAAEWSRFQRTVMTRSNQKKMRIKLRVWCYAQKAWFDELKVIETAMLPSRAPDGSDVQADLSDWSPADTTPPCVCLPKPAPNDNAHPRETIGAEFSEQGSGIDIASVKVLLDEQDVTAQAEVTPGGITLNTAAPLSPGPHRVRVSVADRAGNEGNVLSWRFGVGQHLTNKLSYQQGPLRLNGELFFPIGIYAYCCHPADGRFREDHLAQAAAAGYNYVLNTTERREGLDKELACGIMGTLNITADLSGCTDPAAAQVAIFESGQGRLSDHPAVMAYWADDPENIENTEGTPTPNTTLEKLGHARAALKRQTPRIPSVFAISNLPRLDGSMVYGDILVSYRYPTPQYHPMMIYSWSLRVCQQKVKDKPIWFLSQAVDLGYGPHFKSMGEMRPTVAEMRAMAFYSLICGVKGYCIYANYLNKEDFPCEWAEALEIARRMRHLAPTLAAGEAASTATIRDDVTSGSILHREITRGGRHTLIAVNLSGGRVAAQWRFRKRVRAVVLFEDRRMSRKSERMSDLLEPWDVHIYQW